MKTIKSKLPFCYAREKFIDFLNSNNLYNKYFTEFMWSYRSPQESKSLEAYWDEWIEDFSQYHWIDGIFVFEDSVLGRDFWNMVNLQWYKELDTLNEEYIKSLEVC
jgi:hypothetical protein